MERPRLGGRGDIRIISRKLMRLRVGPGVTDGPRQTGYFRQKTTQNCTKLSKQERGFPGHRMFVLLLPAVLELQRKNVAVLKIPIIVILSHVET